MEKIELKKRNLFVDIMRGIAMLLVVLGHTMTGCTTNSQESIIFNIVWSLQMPLFVLISGYVTKYSESINDSSALKKFVTRRTYAYLLTWIVWSLLVRGLLWGQHDFWNLKYMLWHMDSGYWFLVTIWTISIVYGIATFIANSIKRNNLIGNQLLILGFYLVGMLLLFVIGIIAGMSFFAIKLTLYYMPFYYIGYLYGQFDKKILENPIGEKVVDIIVAICFVVWIFILLRLQLYTMSERGLDVVERFVTSLMGCIAICGLCKGIFSGGGALPSADSVWKDKIKRLLSWAGKNSLGIYMLHGLFLNVLKITTLPLFTSLYGYLLTACNFTLTVLFCAIALTIVTQNSVLKKILCIK